MIDFFPKCLHGDDELIVQENLVLDGKYTMHSKEDRQDECTARYFFEMVKKTFGKLASIQNFQTPS